MLPILEARRKRCEDRAAGDMWALACSYMPWFALECHFTPDQVFDMPWVQLVELTLAADDIADRRRSEQQQAEIARNRAPQRMM